MQGLIAIALLALASISVTALYLLVRRGQLDMRRGILYFGAANIIIFILFSLAQQSSFIQSILAGILLGGLFSVLAGVTAGYFRSNEQAAAFRTTAPNDPALAAPEPVAQVAAPEYDEYGENWVNRKV